jgi:hypothetical protein
MMKNHLTVPQGPSIARSANGRGPRVWSLALLLAIGLIATPTRLVQAQYGEVSPPPTDLQVGFDTISAQQAEEWLSLLAGPQFEGRGTGQVGYMKAAHWIAGKLAEFGLEPAGDGDTYFQMMPITIRLPQIDACRILGPEGLVIEGPGVLGFERYTDQGEIRGKAAFLSFVGPEPKLPEELDLREAIVFYSADAAAAPSVPRLLARLRPAATMRLIDSAPISAPQTLFPGRRSRSTSASGTILRTEGQRLATAMGAPEGWDQETKIFTTDAEVTLRLQLREQPAGTPNVLGWLEGSDPELKHEYVVIGAHLDHLGISGDQLFPGADDNGSGSVAVLSIARAMAANPVKPKRSVLFMWFTAEEVGLLGSRYYTDNPLKPLENMTCMLNIDMVGRNEDQGPGDADADNEGHIHLVGSQRGETALHDLILEANKHIGFEFELDMESVWNRSDQVNFYNKGVPVAFMFGGFHPDYHQPSDTPDRINYLKIQSAARLYYLSLHAAANHGRFPMKQKE